MLKIFIRLTIAGSAVATGLCADLPASRASFGAAPWCLVKTGDDIYWDCQYNTSQECLRAIASGVRGFCNVNPSPGAAKPAAAPRRTN